MLLELTQSSLAEEGLRRVGVEVLKMLDQLAAGASAQEARESWDLGTPPSMGAVEAVRALTASQRGSLRAAVDADLAFDAAFADPRFEFAFPRLDADTKKAGRELLDSLYAIFRDSGFHLDGEVVNRKRWEESFRHANPTIEICPACVVARLPPPVRGRSLVDADHYLPKSKYAALAVHGLNLVPLCKECNQILKGRLDPLFDGGTVLGLNDIWFPYRRAGIKELVVGFLVTDEPSLRFEGPQPALDRAERFDRIFALVERWNQALGGITQRLLTSIIDREVPLEDDAIRNELRVQKRMADRDTASDDRAFVTSLYLHWLLRHPDAFRAFVVELRVIRAET